MSYVHRKKCDWNQWKRLDYFLVNEIKCWLCLQTGRAKRQEFLPRKEDPRVTLQPNPNPYVFSVDIKNRLKLIVSVIVVTKYGSKWFHSCGTKFLKILKYKNVEFLTFQE